MDNPAGRAIIIFVPITIAIVILYLCLSVFSVGDPGGGFAGVL